MIFVRFGSAGLKMNNFTQMQTLKNYIISTTEAGITLNDGVELQILLQAELNRAISLLSAS